MEDGQFVNDGDPLFELETDKISTEVPAPTSGVISIETAEGEIVEIGATVGNIDPQAAAPTISDDAEDNIEEEPQPELKTITSRHERGKISPAARALLDEHAISPDAITGTGVKGHITKGDVLAFIEKQGALEKKEPVAPPTPVKETTAPPAAGTTLTPAASSATDRVVNPGEKRTRLSPLRQRIATRLVQAQHTAAILTTFNEIDMSHCVELRKRFKDRFAEKHETGLGFMSFFSKAAIKALEQYPLINAQIDGTDLVEYDHINLGIAVGTDKGLVVPVLKNAQDMGFADIERGIREFAGKARKGGLTINDMQGGTFTITNGGVYGSLMSTPIINPPQSGILGMHAIKERPIAVDGEVVIRPMMYVALSYDHRIVDGAEAVGFLIRIKELIEEPERLIFDL